VALGEEVGLHPLEPADHLVRQAFHFGEPARDRRRLLAQAFAQGGSDGVGQHHLQLVRGLRQRLDLEPRPLERGCDVGRKRGSVVHLG